MEFTAPKNFKSGRLIANKYTWIDLLLAVGLAGVSVIGFIVYMLNLKNNVIQIPIVIMICVPALIGTLMVIPAGVRHNALTYVHLIIIYFKTRKKYVYSGIINNDTNNNGDIYED